MILGDLIIRNARLFASAPAVIVDGVVITHGQMAARTMRLANALFARGVGRGGRVAILAQNCPEYYEVYGAGEIAGWATIAINFRLATPEIGYILSDSQPEVLIYAAEYAPHLAALAGQLPFIKHFIRIGAPEGDDGGEAYEAVCDAASAEPLPIRAEPDDIAYILYTSGTTGRPKGVMLGQRGQVQAAQIICIESYVEPTDSVALVMPLYHIGAKITSLAHAWRGCPIVLHHAFRPDALMASIAAHKVTTTLLAPTMLKDVLDMADFERYDRSSLRKIFYSAAPMPSVLLKRAIERFGPIFTQFYGATESGAPATTLHRHQHHLEGPEAAVRRLASAGQAMNGCEIRIVDDAGADCGPDVPGEILVRSEALMLGYWNNPDATAEAFADGWLRTGDIGVFDEEAFVFIVDRKKDMIVSGGENIYSREVEEALLSHADIAEVAVVGRPDPRWGEAVVAFVVCRPGAQLTAEAVGEHCRKMIAAFKRPKDVRFVDELPKLPNGKIEKTKLRQLLWEDQPRNV